MSRRINRPYVKKCITICIQAHGSITTKNVDTIDTLDASTRKNVSVLNIASGITRSGLMDVNCSTLNMMGNKKKSIGDVTLCCNSLDLMTVEYFHHVYHDLFNKRDAKRIVDGCDVAKEAMEFITENIPLIYANSNIPYYHDYHKDDIMTNPSESFKLIKPHYNKLYSIYPNDHEDCANKKDCEAGRCKLLPEGKRVCPEYGITVLHSTDNTDTDYTLYGLPILNKDDYEDDETNDIRKEQNRMTVKKENRLTINLNQQEGHEPLNVKTTTSKYMDYENFDEDGNPLDEDGNPIGSSPQKKSCYEFWRSKLTMNNRREASELQLHINRILKQRDAYKMDPTISEEAKSILNNKISKLNNNLYLLNKKWQERLNNYDRMTNVVNRYDLIKIPDLLPQVTLVNLIDIFINGMKYDHIYIIDPSCNHFEFSGNRPSQLLKITAHNLVERIRTKTDRAPYLPIEYVKQYNNPTDEVVDRVVYDPEWEDVRTSLKTHDQPVSNVLKNISRRSKKASQLIPRQSKKITSETKKRVSIGGRRRCKKSKRSKNTLKSKR